MGAANDTAGKSHKSLGNCGRGRNFCPRMVKTRTRFAQIAAPLEEFGLLDPFVNSVAVGWGKKGLKNLLQRVPGYFFYLAGLNNATR